MEQIEKLSKLILNNYLTEFDENKINQYFNKKIDLDNIYRLTKKQSSDYKQLIEIENSWEKTYTSLIQLGKTHNYAIIKANQSLHILVAKKFPLEYNKEILYKIGVVADISF
ncbi:MAG: hypothetical protein RLZZ414_1067 [Bacteroidota bacterium]|jgi:hypothetical protein